MDIGSIAKRVTVMRWKNEMRGQEKWSRGRPRKQVLFLWALPVEGNRLQLAVLFEGSFREGTIVNKKTTLAVSTLLDAFIFQKNRHRRIFRWIGPDKKTLH